MLQARLYQPSKTAMQSGKAKTKGWVLEFTDPDAKFHDPVMGWPATDSTKDQSKIMFDTFEEALAFAESKGITPTILQSAPRTTSPKSYADNFTKGWRS